MVSTLGILKHWFRDFNHVDFKDTKNYFSKTIATKVLNQDSKAIL